MGGADGQTVRSIEYVLVRTRVGFACINIAISIKSCQSHHASIPMHGSRAAAKAGHKKRIPFFQKQKIYNDSSVSVHRYLAIYLGTTTCSQRMSLRRSDGPPRDRGLHRIRWRECPDINFLFRWDSEWIIAAWLYFGALAEFHFH